MPGFATNLLVRWLIRDDTEQYASVGRLIAGLPPGQRLLVPVTVALELEWVLRSRYRLDKAEVLAAFDSLLETDQLMFQEEESVEWALHSYRIGTAYFADGLHAAQCIWMGYSPMLTLGVTASRMEGVELLLDDGERYT